MRSTAVLVGLGVFSMQSMAWSQTPASRVLSLHRGGHHAQLERVLQPGVQVVQSARVDVDGDGDSDALLTVEGSHGSKLIDARGVVVAYNERLGWRAVTVASTQSVASNEGYQWGQVETVQSETAPWLHVVFSHAGPDGSWQRELVLQHQRGKGFDTLHSVEARAPGFRFSPSIRLETHVSRTSVELLEQVQLAEVVDVDGMMHPDAPRQIVRERVLRWNPSQRRFEPVQR